MQPCGYLRIDLATGFSGTNVAIAVLVETVDMKCGHIGDAQPGIYGNGNEVGEILTGPLISISCYLIFGWPMMNVARPLDIYLGVTMFACIVHALQFIVGKRNAFFQIVGRFAAHLFDVFARAFRNPFIRDRIVEETLNNFHVFQTGIWSYAPGCAKFPDVDRGPLSEQIVAFGRRILLESIQDVGVLPVCIGCEVLFGAQPGRVSQLGRWLRLASRP